MFTHQSLGQFKIHPEHQRRFAVSLMIVGGGEELAVLKTSETITRSHDLEMAPVDFEGT